ncbi:hypothetical protein COOONC_18934 [Cooperia oncophora]
MSLKTTMELLAAHVGNHNGYDYVESYLIWCHHFYIQNPYMTSWLRLPILNPRQHVAILSENTALRLTHTYAPEFGQMSRNYVVW